MPESVLYLRTSSYMAAPLMFSAVTTTKKMTDELRRTEDNNIK